MAKPMPARVDVIHRRVVDIRIAVQSLHAAGDNGIRLGEASLSRVIPASVIPTGGCALEHKAEVRGVGVLSRVRVDRGGHSGIVAHLSPGGVPGLRDNSPHVIGHKAG